MTTQVEQIAVTDLHVDGNPRKTIDEDQLKQLVASIEQNGILEPLRVVRNENGYRIESGQRRWTAALAAGIEFVPCVIVTHEDAADEKVKAIVTNVQREDMNPVDEARAYERLGVEHGLSVVGIAEKVGVPKARVTMRLELLELPDEILDLYAAEQLPLSARTSLLAMSKVSEPLALAAAKLCAGKPEWSEVLAKEPGRIATHIAADEKLGKKFTHTNAEILWWTWNGELHNPLGLKDDAIKPLADLKPEGLRVHFDEDAIDSLRAGGVVYTGKGSDVGVICDLPYAKDAAALVVERKAKAIVKQREQQAKEKARSMVASGAAGENEADEAAEALKEFRRQLRQAEEQGRAKGRAQNALLGTNLLNHLAKVDVGGLTAEQVDLIVHQLVASNLAELFQRGLRYCLAQYEVREESKTKAGATKVKITYKAQTKTEATKLALEFLGGAKTPGEKLGRALILVAAARWADQGVVPQSQQAGSGLRQASLGYDATGDGTGTSLGSMPCPTDKLVPKTVIPAPLRATFPPSHKDKRDLEDKNPELAAKVRANQTR